MIKTGIAAITLVAHHGCHILVTWRPKIDAVIAAAVASSTITAAQATTVTSWLNLTQAACDVLHIISGY